MTKVSLCSEISLPSHRNYEVDLNSIIKKPIFKALKESSLFNKIIDQIFSNVSAKDNLQNSSILEEKINNINRVFSYSQTTTLYLFSNAQLDITNDQYKELFNLLRIDNEKHTHIYFSLFLELMDKERLLELIPYFLDTDSSFFINVLKSSAYKKNLCSLGNDNSQLFLPTFVLSIAKYIQENYWTDTDLKQRQLGTLLTLEQYGLNFIYNEFDFCEDKRQLKKSNNILSPLNFGKQIQESKYLFNIYQSSYYPTWFSSLIHLKDVQINKTHTVFDFLNILTSLLKNSITISSFVTQLHKKNIVFHVSGIDYKHFLSQNVYTTKDYWTEIHALFIDMIKNQVIKKHHIAQYGVMLLVLKETISEFNKYCLIPDEYNFESIIEDMFLCLQEKYPNIIINKNYVLKTYSPILFDFDEKLYFIENLKFNINNHTEIKSEDISVENSLHIFSKVFSILNKDTQYVDEIFDLTFSMTNMLEHQYDFDIFNNYSLFYKNNLGCKIDYSLKFNTQNDMNDKLISSFHFYQNKKVIQSIRNDEFKFFNALENFEHLGVFLEFAQDELKEQILNEFNALYAEFLKPRTTLSKFLFNAAFQFNLSAEKEPIYTSIFQQTFFRKNNVGFSGYRDMLLNEKYQIQNLQFLNDENLISLHNEMVNFLDTFSDSNNAFNLSENNSVCFINSEMFVNTLLTALSDIAVLCKKDSTRNEIIEINNINLFPLLNKIFPVSSTYDFFVLEPDNNIREEIMKKFRAINLHLQLDNNDKIVRVRNKI